MGVVNEKEAIAAELIAISHPVAFLDGSMGAAPPVEDLHVALLEAQQGQLRPSVQKVLSMLPQQPLLPKNTPQQQQQQQSGAVDAAAGVGASAGAGASQTEQQPSSSSSPAAAEQQHQQRPAAAASSAAASSSSLTPQQLYGGGVIPDELLQLLPNYWEGVGIGPSDVSPLSSKALMRMLQASSWGEEFRDPATSQVRGRVVG